MPFRIIREDLTRIKADAIVNTANPEPVIGSGTDHAVYQAAGAEALLADRKKIGPIPPGEVAATGAHALHARYILHTVGPDWRREEPERASMLLASCYRKSLLLAQQLGCESIAFPLISAGNYGYPREQALQIALDTIRAFLQDAEMDVTLAVYDRNSYALSTSLTDHVDAYIDERYIEERTDASQAFRRRRRPFGEHSVGAAPAAPAAPGNLYHAREDYEDAEVTLSAEDLESTAAAGPESPAPANAAPAAPVSHDAHISPAAGRPPETSRREQAARPFAAPGAPAHSAAPGTPARPSAQRPAFLRGRKLKDLLNRKQETFQQQLLRLIDEKGYTDVEVYKRANVDRKLFSKIRSNPEYKPQKKTAMALAMALRLNMDETTDLLRLAGLALSPASLMDVIVGYCIENRIYDLFEVNALLFEYDQPLLG